MPRFSYFVRIPVRSAWCKILGYRAEVRFTVIAGSVTVVILFKLSHDLQHFHAGKLVSLNI
jgi:hypothetical protein